MIYNNIRMADKIIRDVDHQTWRKFTGWCKMNGTKSGNKLTEILKSFLKRKNIK